MKKAISDRIDKDVWQRNLTPFLLLWRKLNQGLDFVKMHVPDVSIHNSPIQSFITNEFRDAIVLIQTIHKDFSMIHKIIKGQLVLQNDHYSVLDSLLKLEVSQLCAVTFSTTLLSCNHSDFNKT